MCAVETVLCRCSRRPFRPPNPLEEAVAGALDHGQVVEQPVLHVVLADGVEDVAKLGKVLAVAAVVGALAQRHTLGRLPHADLARRAGGVEWGGRGAHGIR